MNIDTVYSSALSAMIIVQVMLSTGRILLTLMEGKSMLFLALHIPEQLHLMNNRSIGLTHPHGIFWIIPQLYFQSLKFLLKMMKTSIIRLRMHKTNSTMSFTIKQNIRDYQSTFSLLRDEIVMKSFWLLWLKLKPLCVLQDNRRSR